MSITIPYFKTLERDNLIYSVDSIRIAFFLDAENTYSLFDNYEYLNTWFANFEIKSDPEIAHRRLDFEICYSVPDHLPLKAHVSISVYGNGCSNGFVHFNPNRLFQSQRAYAEITNFFKSCSYTEVKKCDVAIDIPCSINCLMPLKGRKKMLLYMHSAKDYSVYWGNRNDIGCAKLYSKSSKNHLPYNLTRLEITLGNPKSSTWFKQLNNAIPPVYKAPFAVNDSHKTLTSPEKIILLLSEYLLQDFINRIVLFRFFELYEDKARRKIVKDSILSGSIPLQVDISAINEIVDTVCENILSLPQLSLAIASNS